ncbi:TAP1 protein, partial [Herpetotheres cachinnans]|nr:TAP1 protein [Herpetotheres cachinnans]
GEVAVPYFTGHVTDWVASEDKVAATWAMALLGLGSAVTEFICDVIYMRMLRRLLGRLQRSVFATVLRQDVTSLQAMGTGAVTARVTGDVETTHAVMTEALSTLLWYLARGTCLLVTMAWLSPHLAFVILLSLPILLLLPWAIGNIQQSLSQQVQDALAGATKVAVETFQAMATIRSFAHEAGAAERYRQRLRHVYWLERKEAVTCAITNWASSSSVLALKLGLLYYGGQLVAAGTITTGDLVTFLLYQMQFTNVMEVLFHNYPIMAKAVGSSEKIFEFLDQAEQVTPMGTLAPDVLRGHLQLEDVWFSYSKHQEPVLRGVSLELRPGEVLAVLAPPGAGKSTLVSLVLHLRPPGAGRVLLDGHPLPAYQHRYLRCQVAAIPQEPVLFSRSLHCVPLVPSPSVPWASGPCVPLVPTSSVPWVPGPRVPGTWVPLAPSPGSLVPVSPGSLTQQHPGPGGVPFVPSPAVEQEIFGASGAGRAVLLVTGQVALAMRAQRVAVLEGGRLHQLGSPGKLLQPGSHYWQLLQGGGQGGTAGDGDMGKEGEG